MTIHEKIKAIRKHLELNQEEFAGKTHITQEAISMLERGVNKPSYEFLYTLIDELKVNPFFVFGDHPKIMQEGKLDAHLAVRQQRAINDAIGSLKSTIKTLTDIK